MKERVILHCDLNNFYASVEQVENPNLNAKYLAVAGNTDQRHGIILAKNTLAKMMGVKTGEPIWQAKQKCPELVCVLPHYELYVQYSNAVKDIYKQYTDKIESFGMDECWLDVTDCQIFGNGEQIANKLRKEVFDKLGLTISVGVSFCKVFAKLGSDMKKPDATTVISKENFKRKVWPLPIEEMLYVGKQTKTKLNKLGIFTLQQLALADCQLLQRQLGVNGKKLWQCANGLDDTPVSDVNDAGEIKSVSHGTTTVKDMTSYAEADRTIEYLSELVATRLRRYGLEGSVVHLTIRRNDLSHQSHQQVVPRTFVANEILKCAKKLLRQIWNPCTQLPLRSLTVAVAQLEKVSDAVQCSIFDQDHEKKQRLEFAIDQIRKRYGFESILLADCVDQDLLIKSTAEEDMLPFKRK